MFVVGAVLVVLAMVMIGNIISTFLLVIGAYLIAVTAKSSIENRSTPTSVIAPQQSEDTLSGTHAPPIQRGPDIASAAKTFNKVILIVVIAVIVVIGLLWLVATLLTPPPQKSTMTCEELWTYMIEHNKTGEYPFGMYGYMGSYIRGVDDNESHSVWRNMYVGEEVCKFSYTIPVSAANRHNPYSPYDSRCLTLYVEFGMKSDEVCRPMDLEAYKLNSSICEDFCEKVSDDFTWGGYFDPSAIIQERKMEALIQELLEKQNH